MLPKALCFLLFLLFISEGNGGRWKPRPEEDEPNDEPKEYPRLNVTSIRKPVGLDPFQCDTLLLNYPIKRNQFEDCCRSFPRGFFLCPRFAPPEHRCGVVHPPRCCHSCPPTTTTTSKPKYHFQDKFEYEDYED